MGRHEACPYGNGTDGTDVFPLWRKGIHASPKGYAGLGGGRKIFRPYRGDGEKLQVVSCNCASWEEWLRVEKGLNPDGASPPEIVAPGRRDDRTSGQRDTYLSGFQRASPPEIAAPGRRDFWTTGYIFVRISAGKPAGDLLFFNGDMRAFFCGVFDFEMFGNSIAGYPCNNSIYFNNRNVMTFF